MTIKSINHLLCETCRIRLAEGCPVIESCSVDVIRADNEGKPLIVYPMDCHACFLCRDDCPNGAVDVSAEIRLILAGNKQGGL